MTEYIIDFEGYFDRNNRFVFKEICFFNIEKKSYNNFFLSSPFFVSKTYFWLLHYFHYIPWFYGKIHYSFIRKNFFNQNFVFYVKSFEQIKILQQHTKSNIFLIVTDKIKNLKEPPYRLTCEYKKHNTTEHCALYKVHKLAFNWDGPRFKKFC